jgi:hypothetical protein
VPIGRVRAARSSNPDAYVEGALLAEGAAGALSTEESAESAGTVSVRAVTTVSVRAVVTVSVPDRLALSPAMAGALIGVLAVSRGVVAVSRTISRTVSGDVVAIVSDTVAGADTVVESAVAPGA